MEPLRLVLHRTANSVDVTDKIPAALEDCAQRAHGKSQTSMLNAVATITMELMQGYDIGDGIIGVDDIDRWPLDSEAFHFLEATSVAQSINALIKVSTLP